MARLAGAGTADHPLPARIAGACGSGHALGFVDYVHTRAGLAAVELLVRGAAVLLGGASVLAVLKLFLSR